jgi:protein associated with RNAse G/E
MESADRGYESRVIKSFKHNGSLHRMWLENWQVPEDRLYPGQSSGQAWILINEYTKIVEGSGREWISRVPAVSFFLPERWYNVVALIGEDGIRYYCNLASPPYRYENVVTYIDYDLDVVVLPDGTMLELDREEYAHHKQEYRYGKAVEERINQGLQSLQAAIAGKHFPFDDNLVLFYYEQWKRHRKAEEEGKAP